MTAETRTEVAERASAIARDVLNLPLNGIHFYDPDRDGLVPMAVSDKVYEVLGEPPVIEPNEGIAWTAYETGDAHIYGDVRDAPEVLDPDTPIRSEFHIPLGQHGVLVAASTTPHDFTDADVASAKILAANVETALNRAEREQELERETERLDEFASIVSHDLRNPLNVAQGRTTLLEQEYESEHLEPLQTALERMEEIIDDTLTLARNGERVGEMESVTMASRLDNCWETVPSAAATLEIEDDVTIHADPDRVRDICENLLHNAIEHGGKDVTVRIGQADENTIYIEDDGPGIPEDERDAVFEPGYSSVSGGTGFGLAIVQQLAEAHGWDITLTDSESGGARFKFSDVEIQ